MGTFSSGVRSIIVFVLMLTVIQLAANPVDDAAGIVPGPDIDTSQPADVHFAVFMALQDDAQEKVYTVVRGDCLSSIAARFLGDYARYWDIVEANKDRYPSIAKNPDLIYPGWKLIIPGVKSTGSDQSPSQNQDKLNPGIGTVEVNTTLNVRTGAWGKIIGSLRNGDKVDVLGKQGDWYKISYDGSTAFVHANYVSMPGRPAGKTPVQNDADGGEQQPVTTGSGRFGAPVSQPLASSVSSPYGWRIHPISGVRKFHYGIDLPMPNGTRLNALGDGVVTAVGYDSTSGNFIKVRYDNGLESFYCHLKKASVSQGQRVNMGQEVARSNNTGGSTGPHLHFGLKKNGSYINPASVSNIPMVKGR